MATERILQLLAKSIGNTASEKETAELNELLLLHPDMYYFIEVLQSIEGEKKHYEPVIEEEAMVKEGWSLLEPFLPDGTENERQSGNNILKKTPIIKWWRQVAIWGGILVLSCSLLYLWKSRTSLTEKAVALNVKEVLVPFGAPEKKILPDSSIVWLNSGSNLRYTEDFGHERREIYLNGEAYFNVKYDPRKPFIVHAGNIVVNVLGTEFNLKAYGDEKKIEATLINGKVQVQIADNPDKKIMLIPNEKLTVVNQRFNPSGNGPVSLKELSFQVRKIEPLQTTVPVPEIAWLEDKLAFQNQRFAELAKEMERRFDIHIIFADTLLKNERLSGVLENEDIDKIMQLLQMTTPFHYKIMNDTVYLK